MPPGATTSCDAQDARTRFIDEFFEAKPPSKSYRELRESAIRMGVVQAEPDGANTDEALKKGQLAAREVLAALRNAGLSASARSLLDLGCGDGSTTVSLAELLGVPPERRLGLEYESTADVPSPRPPVSDDFCFALYTDHPAPALPCTFDIRLPPQTRLSSGGGPPPDQFDEVRNPSTPDYPLHVRDGSFDVVTAFRSLHHISPAGLTVVLREVVRVLKVGGIFIVKEHDCLDETFSHFLDKVHHFKQHISQPGGEREMYTKYESCASWQRIIEDAGLMRVHAEECQGSLLRDVIIIFKKESDGSSR